MAKSRLLVRGTAKSSYFCISKTQSTSYTLEQSNTISKEAIVSIIAEIWNLLTTDQRDFLFDQLSVRSYRRNELVYREGEKPELLMCLMSGNVKIYKVGTSTRQQIMRLIRPGQYFGYRAYFANQCYVTEACPYEESLICFIPMSCIDLLTHTNKQLANLFIRLLATDLGISDQRSVILTQSHVRGRLAEALLFLKNNYGLNPKTNALNIQMTREDLASFSNMTTANCIRTLSSFLQEGLVSLEGRSISIVNEAKLVKIAQIG